MCECEGCWAKRKTKNGDCYQLPDPAAVHHQDTTALQTQQLVAIDLYDIYTSTMCLYFVGMMHSIENV